MKAQDLQIKFVDKTKAEAGENHQVILNGVDITKAVKNLTIEKGVLGFALAKIELWVTVNA